MRLMSIQEALSRRFERQRAISELEYHAAGHCVHVGKLSPGCYGCFVPSSFRFNRSIGLQCNMRCTYCPTERSESDPAPDQRAQLLKRMELELHARHLHATAFAGDPKRDIPVFSMTGGGEPLLHMEVIAGAMDLFRKTVWPKLPRKPWCFLYTNGLLADIDTIHRLRDLGFDELRFHLGASGFSEQVYSNIEKAVPEFRAISVETPAWPAHRGQLFAMLPRIADMGVRHLNIGEIEVTRQNYERIAEVLPNGEIYHNYEMHLYGGDLVYDIFEEIIRRSYPYSVLDCCSLVKSIQRSPAKEVDYEDVGDLCAEYDDCE